MEGGGYGNGRKGRKKERMKIERKRNTMSKQELFNSNIFFYQRKILKTENLPHSIKIEMYKQCNQWLTNPQ
jgi:hypothetical protein